MFENTHCVYKLLNADKHGNVCLFYYEKRKYMRGIINTHSVILKSSLNNDGLRIINDNSKFMFYKHRFDKIKKFFINLDTKTCEDVNELKVGMYVKITSNDDKTSYIGKISSLIYKINHINVFLFYPIKRYDEKHIDMIVPSFNGISKCVMYNNIGRIQIINKNEYDKIMDVYEEIKDNNIN